MTTSAERVALHVAQQAIAALAKWAKYISMEIPFEFRLLNKIEQK